MKSYFWVFVEKFGGVGLRVLGMMLLARVLSPTDFGLFGMIAIIGVFGQVLIDSGMGGALIKKENVSEVDYTTVFTFNFISSLVFFFIIYLLSSFIAKFYNEPLLVEVVPYLGVTLVFRALSLVPVTKLTKDLNFKVQTKISLVSYVLAFIVGYYLAGKGYGIYALVYLSILEVVIFTILIFYVVGYIPRVGFNFQSFKGLYLFGVNLAAASIVRTLYENSLNIIIGKMFGAQVLGFYYQASKINDIFIGTTTNVINKASFPILVKYCNNDLEMKQSMRTLLSNVCWLTFIICVFLSFYSELIILTLFGGQWSESANLLSIISFAGLGMVIEAITRCFLKSYGYADVILKLEVKKRLVGIAIILLSMFGGLEVMLAAYAFSTVIFSLFNMLKVHEYTVYSFTEQLLDVYKPLLFSIITYIFLFIGGEVFVYDGLITFLLSSTLYFFALFVCSSIFSKGAARQEN